MLFKLCVRLCNEPNFLTFSVYCDIIISLYGGYHMAAFSDVSSTKYNISAIPTETLSIILNNLSPYDLDVTKKVSTLWRSVSNKAFENYNTFHHCVFKGSASGLKTAPHNPMLRSLHLDGLTDLGFLSFAKAHPQINLLTIENCDKMSVTSIVMALCFLNHLESIDLVGQKMFDERIVEELAKKTSLRRIRIIDTSEGKKADELTLGTIAEIPKISKILLKLTLPNKKFLLNNVQDLKDKFVNNPSNLQLICDESRNRTSHTSIAEAPKKPFKGLFRFIR